MKAYSGDGKECWFELSFMTPNLRICAFLWEDRVVRGLQRAGLGSSHKEIQAASMVDVQMTKDNCPDVFVPVTGARYGRFQVVMRLVYYSL
jgi:hypothetical protein